ncbi:hypothetical protein Vretifemale_21032, partial [Volvox reticuliferus]
RASSPGTVPSGSGCNSSFAGGPASSCSALAVQELAAHKRGKLQGGRRVSLPGFRALRQVLADLRAGRRLSSQRRRNTECGAYTSDRLMVVQSSPLAMLYQDMAIADEEDQVPVRMARATMATAARPAATSVMVMAEVPPPPGKGLIPPSCPRNSSGMDDRSEDFNNLDDAHQASTIMGQKTFLGSSGDASRITTGTRGDAGDVLMHPAAAGASTQNHASCIDALIRGGDSGGNGGGGRGGADVAAGTLGIGVGDRGGVDEDSTAAKRIRALPDSRQNELTTQTAAGVSSGAAMNKGNDPTQAVEVGRLSPDGCRELMAEPATIVAGAASTDGDAAAAATAVDSIGYFGQTGLKMVKTNAAGAEATEVKATWPYQYSPRKAAQAEAATAGAAVTRTATTGPIAAAAAMKIAAHGLAFPPPLPVVQEVHESGSFSCDAASREALVKGRDADNGDGINEDNEGFGAFGDASETDKPARGISDGSKPGRVGSSHTHDPLEGLPYGAPSYYPYIRSVPLPQLQMPTHGFGAAACRSGVAGDISGGIPLGQAQLTQPLAIVSTHPLELQNATKSAVRDVQIRYDKPSALYNSTPLPFPNVGGLRLPMALAATMESDLRGIAPWVQMGNMNGSNPTSPTEDDTGTCPRQFAKAFPSAAVIDMQVRTVNTPQLDAIEFASQHPSQSHSHSNSNSPRQAAGVAATSVEPMGPHTTGRSSRFFNMSDRTTLPVRPYAATAKTSSSSQCHLYTAAYDGDTFMGETQTDTTAGAMGVMQAQITALRAHLLDPSANPFPD